MATRTNSRVTNTMVEKAEPFLKWAGGKRQLLDELNKHSPQNFNSYHEPMLGAGALFFNLNPDSAVINDVNEDLMITFKGVRDNLEKIIQLLKTYKEKHSEDFYYNQRDKYNLLKKRSNDDEIVERAAIFIYLNRTCYNGLYRVNSNGEFNVPFGKYKNPTICFEERLHAVSKVLSSASIRCQDFEEAVEIAEKNDFIYFDPPYDPVSETANFTGYTDDGFGKDEQKRLAETYRDLDSRGCKVMLSNSNTDFINDLYQDFNINPVTAKRAINSKGGKRDGAKEVIVINY